MRMREGIPYMLAGSAITLAYFGMKNGNIKGMVNNMVNKVKNKNINKLEDMM